ncbi:MAG: hypothetical protein ACYC5A_10465 [Thermoleophilia bacterium]
MISDRDIRQIIKMKKQVESYETGHITIGSLIGDLEFLLSEIVGIPEDWKTEVDEQIEVLEEVYAFQLEKAVFKLSEEDDRLVRKAIVELRQLLDQQDDLTKP